MDISKVDRIHRALSTQLMVESTEEAANAYEVLTVAMRMFSHLLAAYVADTPGPSNAHASMIETYCREAAAMAHSRLLVIGDEAPS